MDDPAQRALDRVKSFADCFVDQYGFGDDWYRGPLDASEVVESMGDLSGLSPERIDAQADKAVLQTIKSRLENDPRYNLQLVEDVPHPVIAKMVKIVRLKELAAVKIVKKGGGGGLRYDLTGLAATFYGKKILKSIGFERRRVAKADELAELKSVCQKFKLDLPEAVEPTTTEKYFAEHFGATDS